MAETVYKDIPALTAATVPLVGTELIEVSATGATGKAAWANIFGTGWWAQLKVVFSAFKAPDATHADDADTVGLEAPASLHDAAQLTGAVPLGSVPATLTGKDADTVDTYHAGVGTGRLNPFRGALDGAYTGAQIYAALISYLPNTNDEIPINGIMAYEVTTYNVRAKVCSRAKKTSTTQITIYGISIAGNRNTGDFDGIDTSQFVIEAGTATQWSVSITY